MVGASLVLFSLFSLSGTAYAGCVHEERPLTEKGTVTVIGTFCDDEPFPYGKFKVRTVDGMVGPFRSTGAVPGADPVIEAWSEGNDAFFIVTATGVFGPYDPGTARVLPPINGHPLFGGGINGLSELHWNDRTYGLYEEIGLLQDMGWEKPVDQPFFSFKRGGRWYVQYDGHSYGPYDDIVYTLTYVAYGKPVITGSRDGKMYVSWGGVEGKPYDDINMLGMDGEAGPSYYAIRDGMLYTVSWPNQEVAHPEGFRAMMLHNLESAERNTPPETQPH